MDPDIIERLLGQIVQDTLPKTPDVAELNRTMLANPPSARLDSILLGQIEPRDRAENEMARQRENERVSASRRDHFYLKDRGRSSTRWLHGRLTKADENLLKNQIFDALEAYGGLDHVSGIRIADYGSRRNNVDNAEIILQTEERQFNKRSISMALQEEMERLYGIVRENSDETLVQKGGTALRSIQQGFHSVDDFLTSSATNTISAIGRLGAQRERLAKHDFAGDLDMIKEYLTQFDVGSGGSGVTSNRAGVAREFAAGQVGNR